MSPPPALGSIQDYLPMVKAIAARLHQRLPNFVLLDDLISYGLVGVHEALTRYVRLPTARFRTYLFVIVRGRMKDGLLAHYPDARRVRRGGRHTEQLCDAAADAIPARTQAAPCADLMRRELLAQIEQGMTRMERMTLRCYFLDNLSIDQIAALAGCSNGTIYNMVEDLLARLRAREDLRALAGAEAEPRIVATARQARILIHGNSRIHTNRKRWPVRRKGAAPKASGINGQGSPRQGSAEGSAGAQSADAPAQDGHTSGTGVPPVIYLTHPSPAHPSARKESRERERLSA